MNVEWMFGWGVCFISFHILGGASISAVDIVRKELIECVEKGERRVNW